MSITARYFIDLIDVQCINIQRIRMMWYNDDENDDVQEFSFWLLHRYNFWRKCQFCRVTSYMNTGADLASPTCHGTGCFFASSWGYAIKICLESFPISLEASWHWLILASIGALVYLYIHLISGAWAPRATTQPEPLLVSILLIRSTRARAAGRPSPNF